MSITDSNFRFDPVAAFDAKNAEIESLRQQLATAQAEIDRLNSPVTLSEWQQMEQQLEIERHRLAICGFVAMANTPESAANVRDMLPKYRSAACDEVARMVDSEMALRQQLAHREAQIVMLRDAAMPLVLHRHTTNDAEYRAAEKALAATDDLSGYILCEMEPGAWSWENKNVKGNWYLSWREPEPGFNKTPLYIAARRPE